MTRARHKHNNVHYQFTRRTSQAKNKQIVRKMQRNCSSLESHQSCIILMNTDSLAVTILTHTTNLCPIKFYAANNLQQQQLLLLWQLLLLLLLPLHIQTYCSSAVATMSNLHPLCLSVDSSFISSSSMSDADSLCSAAISLSFFNLRSIHSASSPK